MGDEQYGGFLKSRDAMRDFCRGHQESGYDSGFAFGFRADTAQYAYLIRLHPYKGGGKSVSLLLPPRLAGPAHGTG